MLNVGFPRRRHASPGLLSTILTPSAGTATIDGLDIVTDPDGIRARIGFLSGTTGLYDLDFNRAYHPFCYFDETYDCPYPPPQNRLNTAVFAGEKLPPANERRIPLTNYESTSSGLDR